jgi:NADPH:quinone reductase-like Zn-dependent oxidoreductase
MVLCLGRQGGFKTLNVVRRREQAEELRRLGGDAVVCTAEENLVERARSLTGGAGVRYALDAVGGATGAAVVQALAEGGRLVIYGTLSGEPLPLDPRDLIVGQKRVEGFWLSDWVRQQGVLTMLGLFRRVGNLLRAGVLTTEVGATVPLDEVQSAVRQAALPGRQGKVLLRLAVAEVLPRQAR